MDKMIPKSYDIIGDICILNKKGNKAQAQLLLKKFKNIKVILKRSGIHKGKYRTRKLSWLAGEKRKETIHKENNALMKLDVEKCYFSQRLSEERKRIRQNRQDRTDGITGSCADNPGPGIQRF